MKINIFNMINIILLYIIILKEFTDFEINNTDFEINEYIIHIKILIIISFIFINSNIINILNN